MVMQVRRTLTVGATPTGLAEGQISVGMADQPPTAWVGVPASVNPAGVIPITGLVRTVAGAPQPAGALGQLWWDEDAAQLFVFTGNEWVVAVNPPLTGVGEAPSDGFVYGRSDLGWVKIGEAAIDQIVGGVTNLAADGTVLDVASGTVGAGTWLVDLRMSVVAVALGYTTAAASVNTGPNQPISADRFQVQMNDDTLMALNASHVTIIRSLGPQALYVAVVAYAANSGRAVNVDVNLTAIRVG